jgi:hypothetical protein
MKILILSLLLNGYAFSKCLLSPDKEKVENSKIIFIGKIIRSSSNQSPEGHCKAIGATTLPLKYIIEPLEVLKGELGEKVLDLTYSYVCNMYPKSKTFTNGRKYIFSVGMKRKRKIYLRGLACESWGWDIKELEKVKKIISK